MTDCVKPLADLEVRLLATFEPGLSGALAAAGMHCLGQFGVAEVWVRMGGTDGVVAR